MRALKKIMINEVRDLDDEISELYLRKDINHFWQKWNSKFSKKNVIPSMVNGVSGDNKIAEIFRDTFSSVYYDSYSDNTCTVNYLDKLHTVIDVEFKCDSFHGSTLFDISAVSYTHLTLPTNREV